MARVRNFISDQRANLFVCAWKKNTKIQLDLYIFIFLQTNCFIEAQKENLDYVFGEIYTEKQVQ